MAKVRNHLKIHLTTQNHQKYAHVFADLEGRAVIWGLWLVAWRAYAGKTDNWVTLTHADLMWISGRSQVKSALKLVRTWCEVMSYSVQVHGEVVKIQIRNLAKKQGMSKLTAPLFGTDCHPSEFRVPSSEVREEEEQDLRFAQILSVTAPPSAPRLVNLLAREPGSVEEKTAWAIENEPVILAEAEAAFPRDAKARSAKVRSTTLRWWRAHRRRESKAAPKPEAKAWDSSSYDQAKAAVEAESQDARLKLVEESRKRRH